MDETLLRGLLACVVAAGTTFAALPVLRRAGLLDVPSDRSSHHHPTLRGGGIGAAVGASVGLAVSPGLTGSQRIGVAAYAAVCGALGMTDDVVGLPVVARLVLQVTVSAVALRWLLAGTDLGGPALAVAGAGALIWLVGYVNAFNFFDGINGIAVAQAAVAGGAWYAMGVRADAPALAEGGIIIAGAAVGFGFFNFPIARVFLGDVGSYFIGAWLAALAIVGLREAVPAEALVAPLMISLADTSVTRIRRIWEGGDWTTPHRTHVYQRLTTLGWSHTQTTLFAAAAMVVCAVLAIATLSSPWPTRLAAAVCVLAVSGVYLGTPRWIERSRLGDRP